MCASKVQAGSISVSAMTSLQACNPMPPTGSRLDLCMHKLGYRKCKESPSFSTLHFAWELELLYSGKSLMSGTDGAQPETQLEMIRVSASSFLCIVASCA